MMVSTKLWPDGIRSMSRVTRRRGVLLGLMLSMLLSWGKPTASATAWNTPLLSHDIGVSDNPCWIEPELERPHNKYSAQLKQPTPSSMLSQSAYIKASNTDAEDRFGHDVAISGDTLVIGAPNEGSGSAQDQGDNFTIAAGAAYVFVRTGSTWQQQAYLKAPNPIQGGFFGYSVDIDGDTIVVGTNGHAEAYVFVRTGSTWQQQAILTGASEAPGFGYQVAISNHTIVVGGGSESAYVFVRTGSTWQQQAILRASNGESQDWFGSRVDIAGDTIVIGASGEDSIATGVDGNQQDNSALDAGAAYIFVRTGSTWQQQAYLKASNTESCDTFGHAVSISGDTVVISALDESSGSAENQQNNSAERSGAAYVFVRTSETWEQQAYLKSPNIQPWDHFGRSVAIHGDRIIIGASFDGGTVYTFTRTGESWEQQTSLKASNSNSWFWFGSSTALSETTIVVGDIAESSAATGVNGDQHDDSAEWAGAAYIFTEVLPVSARTFLPLLAR